MSTLVEKIALGFTRVTVLLKQAQADLNGKIGTLSSLNTAQKTSLVASLNELKGLVDQKAKIDDASKNTLDTWSSNKIDAAINSAITTLIGGADVDADTLKELADKITAVAQSDQGLVSAMAAQSFSAAQKTQARANIDAAAASEVGDIAGSDFVSTVNSAYTN